MEGTGRGSCAVKELNKERMSLAKTRGISVRVYKGNTRKSIYSSFNEYL